MTKTFQATLLKRICEALALGALVVSMSACEDETVTDLGPELYVDVCDSPAIEKDGEFLGGTTECGLDFGQADISVRTETHIFLSNPGRAVLQGPREEVDGEVTQRPLIIELSEDSDPAFEIVAKPDTIEDGLTRIPVVISYRPNVESTQTATLIIRSDAVNVEDENGTVTVPITGEGVDNGVPDIMVDPGTCDFGRVAQGAVKECTLKVFNMGSRDLVFDDVQMDVTSTPDASTVEPFGFFGRAPQPGEAIPAAEYDEDPTNRSTLSLRFHPDVLGSFSGTLTLLTNDPDQPETVIDLTGIGVNPPTCGANVFSVNGFEVPAGTNPTIEPLDDVILSAGGSEASTASGHISSIKWEIVDRPPGSTVELTNPSGELTGFAFADVLGVDLAGRYTVRATVTDDLGIESVNECDVAFEAIPTDSLLVQLSWDSPQGDMDLHLTKKNSMDLYCPQGVALGSGSVATDCGYDRQDDDCYYANCKASSGSPPDWDDDSASQSAGDPSLDIDDLDGYGPENINIDTAIEGNYLVGVDYYSGSGVVGNTVRIYLYGQLTAEFFKELGDSDFWEVAEIQWPAGCVEDLASSDAECG